MRMDICLAIAIVIVVVIAITATSEGKSTSESKSTSKGESANLPLFVDYKLETIRGHDYLIVWNGCRGCCAIHAESCPCKSGKDTGGVR